MSEKHLDETSYVPIDGPELVVGIVAPVGANLATVIDIIKSEFSKANYTSHVVRVSSLMHQLVKYSSYSNQSGVSEYERIKDHMEAGTHLRSVTKQGSILAMFAMSEIRRLRGEYNQGADGVSKGEEALSPLSRTVYILRSLKHPEEVELLKSVYGKAFVLISAYSPREERVKYLSEVLARSASSSDPSKFRSSAEELICIDEKEEDNKLGQNVSDAFPLADLFIDSRERKLVESGISRFVDYYFGYPYPSPTKDEFAMYMANASAMRSVDLSRQVGAAIANDEGDIVSVGCNDVPKVGGGLYWNDDEHDARDYVIGFDTSAKYKRDMLSELIDKLKLAKWLSDEKNDMSQEELLDLMMDGGNENHFGGVRITDIIEFGRSVHAEMAAITDSAKRGIKIQNGVLYSTTFPCHLCSRHIISSGIKRVVYIQPYPKSQTKILYDDSIVIDSHVPTSGKVRFEPFVGISPNIFTYIFKSNGKRKDSLGRIEKWERINSNPKINRFVLSYLLSEDVIVAKDLPSILKQNKLKLIEDEKQGDDDGK